MPWHVCLLVQSTVRKLSCGWYHAVLQNILQGQLYISHSHLRRRQANDHDCGVWGVNMIAATDKCANATDHQNCYRTQYLQLSVQQCVQHSTIVNVFLINGNPNALHHHRTAKFLETAQA